jgi:NAD(P)-dependent dehydrogenase (short-subunit alcohol dehydrogenase family)
MSFSERIAVPFARLPGGIIFFSLFKRIGKPENVADVVAFLPSDAAAG